MILVVQVHCEYYVQHRNKMQSTPLSMKIVAHIYKIMSICNKVSSVWFSDLASCGLGLSRIRYYSPLLFVSNVYVSITSISFVHFISTSN